MFKKVIVELIIPGFLFIFLNIIYYVISPSLTFKDLPRRILAFIILVTIIICGFIAGSIFYYWKIIKIDVLLSKGDRMFANSMKTISFWKFKDLVVNINDYINISYPTEEMIIYGVNFSKTANDPEEQESLLKILSQRDFKKMTFVCTVHDKDKYSDIVEHVIKFVNLKVFKEIKNKIEIYGYDGNPLENKLILLGDHKLVLYQLDLLAKEDFQEKIKDLAIKITDSDAIDHYFGLVRVIKDKSENILEKVLKGKNESIT